MQAALWPKGWKRVRYSQSWPKLQEHENDSAFPVLTYDDWKKVGRLGVAVLADSNETYEAALLRLITNVIPPQNKVGKR